MMRPQKNGVFVISGASTVPAISSAVLTHHLSHYFSSIDSVDYGLNAGVYNANCYTPIDDIVTGNKAPRGLATISSIMSYVGKPYTTMINSQMKTIYGWQDLQLRPYPWIGKRFVSVFFDCTLTSR